MEPRPPSQSHSELSRLMGPVDANTFGNVHGGVILRLCDEAAGIAAARHSGSRGEGRPAEVPPLRAETSDERRREREAQLRRDNRLEERRRMDTERAGG